MKAAFDLHFHSCLSPCGDGAMTPATIAGLCKLAGLDVAALTDHNTCGNCPAFCEAVYKLYKVIYEFVKDFLFRCFCFFLNLHIKQFRLIKYLDVISSKCIWNFL